MTNAARRLSWVAVLVFFAAFSYEALKPAWNHLTQIDADGWPLGVPHPLCPVCQTDSNVVLETAGSTVLFQCHHCNHQHTAKIPWGTR
jgi:hypothetical protein